MTQLHFAQRVETQGQVLSASDEGLIHEGVRHFWHLVELRGEFHLQHLNCSAQTQSVLRGEYALEELR